MKHARRLAPFVFMALGSFAAFAAGGCNAVDDAIDCAEVCNRYDKCLGGKNYDESACRSTCRSKVDDNKDLEKTLDSCANCLQNDMSCGETAWKCSPECAALLPAIANP